ncbi:hypothetical protein FHR32_003232 [Streptosporangium album]|uniref:Uncharacterized protein n=1 Tax=Streptosporangium album TaxID=47479 RepID=A0A7W7RVJ0_9ACTN|nr:hypothetical protein [Streptosporangium album]MBB4938927.1 hypothetical protein [Streptosporangium album]
MGMSKQTTLTLTFLVGLSVLVPGSAGYLSARMDAVQRAYRDLVSLESRLRDEQLLAQASKEAQIRMVAVPLPCRIPPSSSSKRKKARMPAALIPVPVQPLPPEALPATPRPTEGLRIEPLPADPEAAGPGRRKIGGRYPPAEDGRGHTQRERLDQTNGSGQIMIEQDTTTPIGPLRRIPTRAGRSDLGQETGYPASDQGAGPRLGIGPESDDPGTGRVPDQVEPGQAEAPAN